ncbi:MAG: pro-sigmaK processing inhibitor BofA family protein [Ruminococcus sp.]|nr:pro-sigmaK processing inhibitor BofA family protein [Ruminococcus sp.]
MKSWIYFLCVITVYLLYAVVYGIAKKKKPFKRAFRIMIFGVIMLICVDLASKFTGVYIPISPLSLAVSSCLGVPGVAAMLIITSVL